MNRLIGPWRWFSNRKIPIASMNNDSFNDTEKLHLINQKLHEKLGPIYSQKVGPDNNIIWVADPW